MIFLHNKKMIHRDLKSPNLLVTSDWKIKVCDFGLARPRPQNLEESANLTVAGTLEWMAPEISLEEAYDQPVDVFSFGMVVYELIFRLTPPKRSPLKDYAFVFENYTRPEDTPEGVWELLRVCSQSEPEKRPRFDAILVMLDEIDHTISEKPEQSYEPKRRKGGFNKKQIKADRSHASRLGTVKPGPPKKGEKEPLGREKEPPVEQPKSAEPAAVEKKQTPTPVDLPKPAQKPVDVPVPKGEKEPPVEEPKPKGPPTKPARNQGEKEPLGREKEPERPVKNAGTAQKDRVPRKQPDDKGKPPYNPPVQSPSESSCILF